MSITVKQYQGFICAAIRKDYGRRIEVAAEQKGRDCDPFLGLKSVLDIIRQRKDTIGRN